MEPMASAEREIPVDLNIKIESKVFEEFRELSRVIGPTPVQVRSTFTLAINDPPGNVSMRNSTVMVSRSVADLRLLFCSMTGVQK